MTDRRLLLPRERGLVRYAELWHEGDALLYVHSSRFSDRYARYRFRDIQAIVVTEFPLWNSLRAWWLGVSGFFTMLLAVLPPGAWKLWAVLPGIFLVWAIAYLARGPRCRVLLLTAESTITLEAVRTMAQAREVVPEIRRITEGTQGRLSPDGLTVVDMPPAPAPPVPVHNTPLLLHVFFGMLVLHALLLAGFYFGNKMDSGLGLSGTLLFAELLLGALGALRWRTVGLVMTIACVAVLVLTVADLGVLGYSAVKSMGGFVAAVTQRGARPDEVEWIWMKEQTVCRAAWHAVAGLAGWILLLTTRGSKP